MENDDKMDDLLNKAEQLTGRSVDIEEVEGGDYAVVYMDFMRPSPPTGKTELEALEKFVGWLKEKREVAKEVDPG
jgi:hypothetical protein